MANITGGEQVSQVFSQEIYIFLCSPLQLLVLPLCTVLTNKYIIKTSKQIWMTKPLT